MMGPVQERLAVRSDPEAEPEYLVAAPLHAAQIDGGQIGGSRVDWIAARWSPSSKVLALVETGEVGCGSTPAGAGFRAGLARCSRSPG